MMGLLRDLSIKDVCHHLDIVIQPDNGYQSLAPSVLTAARQRLGEAPTSLSFSCLQRSIAARISLTIYFPWPPDTERRRDTLSHTRFTRERHLFFKYYADH